MKFNVGIRTEKGIEWHDADDVRAAIGAKRALALRAYQGGNLEEAATLRAQADAWQQDLDGAMAHLEAAA